MFMLLIPIVVPYVGEQVEFPVNIDTDKRTPSPLGCFAMRLRGL